MNNAVASIAEKRAHRQAWVARLRAEAAACERTAEGARNLAGRAEEAARQKRMTADLIERYQARPPEGEPG